jgi:hypothetical protein
VPGFITAPAPQNLLLESTRTTGTVTVRTDRRSSLSAGAAYLTSGGLDASSQAVLPEQQGPRVDLLFQRSLSRRDVVRTIANAQAADFSEGPCVAVGGAPATPGARCAPQAQVLLATEGISHLLDRATLLTLDAGVSFARSRVVHAVPYQSAPYATGRLALTHHQGEHGATTLELSAEVAPFIDLRTGLVRDSAQGQVSLGSVMSRVVTMQASASVLQTVPPDQPLAATVVYGQVEGTFHVDRQLELGVGERGLWQNERGAGSFFSAFTYFSVTGRLPALRF